MSHAGLSDERLLAQMYSRHASVARVSIRDPLHDAVAEVAPLLLRDPDTIFSARGAFGEDSPIFRARTGLRST